MQSLKLSFDAVMPIFLLMLLGYCLRTFKLADKENFDAMNKLVFKVFLPVLLFKNIYSTDPSEVFDGKLIVFSLVAIAAIFILGYFSVFVLTKENSRRGVMLQGFFRSNFAILGVPVAGYICGEEAIAVASLMVAIVIPAFNVLAVFALERFRDGGAKLKISTLLKGVVTNPLIIACLVGLVFLLTGIRLPHVVTEAVWDVASVASPLAIIVLGAGFEFSKIKGSLKELIITVVARLIVVPLIVIPIGVWFGFSGAALACLLVAFGGPIAVSSFSMAQQMGGDEDLAAQVVVFSSLFCLVTLFVWIYALDLMKLF